MGVSIFGATWAIFREGAGRQRHCGSCKSQHQLGNSGLGKGVGSIFFLHVYFSVLFFLIVSWRWRRQLYTLGRVLVFDQVYIT